MKKRIDNLQNLFATVSFGAARATLALFLASILPIAASAEDWTVADNTVLTEDKVVDALTIANGKTLDLAGHSLTVSRLSSSSDSASAYIIDTNAVYKAVKSPEPSLEQYIHGFGNLWIDTGIVPECTDTIEMKMFVVASQTDERVIWSALTSSLSQSMKMYTGSWKFAFQRNGKTCSLGSYQQNFYYEITADYNNASFTIDKSDNTHVTEEISDKGSYTVGGPLILFARCRNGYAATHERTEAQMYAFFCSGTANGGGVKLYYFRIRKADGTLRCNFVPAQIANSGVAGLFDTVSGRFVTRAPLSRGTIAAGGDVYEVERVSGGELHVNIASGTVENKSVAVCGSVKLVKEGAGTFKSTTAAGSRPAAYFGGTEVVGGTLIAGAAGTNEVFGMPGSEIVVSEGGTVQAQAGNAEGRDFGCYQDYWFTLNGGTLKSNSNYYMTDGAYLTVSNVFKRISLKKNSNIYSQHVCGMYDYSAADDEWLNTYLDLAGKTLTVDGIGNWGDFRFCRTTATSEGRIDVKAISQGIHFFGVDSDLSRVSLTAEANLKVDDGVTVTLGDYIVNATANYNAHYKSGAGEVKVSGIFKPNTDYYHGCELQDGATLDLGGRTTALNLDGSLVIPKEVDSQYKVSFEDGATVKISIGERKVSSKTPLVTWTEVPSNLASLKFVNSESNDVRKFVVKEDGIYLISEGFVITIL